MSGNCFSCFSQKPLKNIVTHSGSSDLKERSRHTSSHYCMNTRLIRTMELKSSRVSEKQQFHVGPILESVLNMLSITML